MGMFDFLKKKETVTELIDEHKAMPPTNETAGPRNEIVGKLEKKGVFFDYRDGKWKGNKRARRKDDRIEPLDEED
jgi:hypothetical protein